MEGIEYIVSFRKNKSMKDLNEDDNQLLADYLKALGLTIVEVYKSKKTVRIRATESQMATLLESLRAVCHIEKPVVGHARVAGTS